jgi:hypothetical protein
MISSLINRILFESNDLLSGDYNSLWWDEQLDRLVAFKDWNDEYHIKENGTAYIKVGHTPWLYTAKNLGYKNEAEIKNSLKDDDWPKKTIVQTFEHFYKEPIEIVLLDWHATKVGSGFGRSVMMKILELANKYKTKTFRVFLPSVMASSILDHYVKDGFLSQDGNGLNKRYFINTNYSFKETK